MVNLNVPKDSESEAILNIFWKLILQPSQNPNANSKYEASNIKIWGLI